MLTNYNGELELNLKAFGRFMIKKLWIAFAAALFWGILWFFIWETVTVPMYESSSRMIVKKDIDSSEYFTDEDAIYTNYFIETATSGPVLNSITSELDVSYEALSRNVKVYKTSGANTVNISVRYKEPEMAQKIVEEIQQNTIDYMHKTIGAGELIVIEAPYLSTAPVEGNTKDWAIYGAFISFLITVAVILLMFLFDSSIKDSDDVKNCLEEDVFATISSNKKVDKELHNREVYRTLRTDLEYIENAPRIISVISCDDYDGKSTVAYELACSYAQKGKKVLLLDGDLRAASMKGKISKNKDSRSLLDVLSGKYDFGKIDCHTEIKNLEILSAGKPAENSTELLDSNSFGELLEMAKANYEMVIVDTPSMKHSIDAAVITRQCDGALFVIAAEKTKNQMAKDAKMQIEKIGGRILGCVVTRFSKKS